METLNLFLTAYVLGIEINYIEYSTNSKLKPYININQALEACGHNTTQLAQAIEICGALRERVDNKRDKLT